MSQTTQALRFAASFYRQRADLWQHGYLRRDPMARLELRPGRANPYAIYDTLRARGPIVTTRLGNLLTTRHAICRDGAA